MVEKKSVLEGSRMKAEMNVKLMKMKKRAQVKTCFIQKYRKIYE